MKTAILMFLLWASIIIVAGFGWVLNIIAITHMTGITTMFVLRIVGVFVAPLGAALGYL